MLRYPHCHRPVTCLPTTIRRAQDMDDPLVAAWQLLKVFIGTGGQRDSCLSGSGPRWYGMEGKALNAERRNLVSIGRERWIHQATLPSVASDRVASGGHRHVYIGSEKAQARAGEYQRPANRCGMANQTVAGGFFAWRSATVWCGCDAVTVSYKR